MRTSPLLTTFFLLFSASPGFAQSPYRHIDPAKGDTYFGYLSRCDLEGRGELPQVLREGAGAELAEVNFPSLPVTPFAPAAERAARFSSTPEASCDWMARPRSPWRRYWRARFPLPRN
jgi:hypothetical protein